MSAQKVRNLTFNEERTCFTCSMEDGMRLYNVDPLAEKLRMDMDKVGSVSKVAMLHRTSLLAIVGGGSRAKFPVNVVKIWDDSEKKFVLQYKFSQAVLNVHMCNDKIIIALKSCIYVFSFPNDSKQLLQVDTRYNPLGLCEVGPLGERHVLATMGHAVGCIQIIDLSILGKDSSSPISINAHQTDVACLALNSQGTVVATASEKGTLIRLFDTTTRQKLVELRRGSDQAVLHSINFNPSSSYLCAASDKGTVHIFALKDTTLNRRSAFAKAGKVSPFQQYTNSQWSFCHFTVPAECACICAFAKGNSVVAACVDGSFHKYIFTAEGNCSREAYDVFLELLDTCDF
uniref:WD repeat domain phosphoinositide-interacting protein 4-like n=1 Tax=Phallusia mammillata TaxID=59560 RepID=A0A6F9DXW0_9ASCI|nr:WD repeat domain phosphoinositide-interacting protein 4-like [Phallusia mammillata]